MADVPDIDLFQHDVLATGFDSQVEASDLFGGGPSDSKMNLGKDVTGVGLFLGGLGTLFKIGAEKQYAAQIRARARLGAEFSERAAGDAVERGRLREYQITAHGDAVIAEQRAQSSVGSLDVNVGAQQQTEAGSRANLEFDRAAVRRNAALEAYGYRAQAQQRLQEGEDEARKAESAEVGTFLSGIADMVKTAGPLVLGA